MARFDWDTLTELTTQLKTVQVRSRVWLCNLPDKEPVLLKSSLPRPDKIELSDASTACLQSRQGPGTANRFPETWVWQGHSHVSARHLHLAGHDCAHLLGGRLFHWSQQFHASSSGAKAQSKRYCKKLERSRYESVQLPHETTDEEQRRSARCNYNKLNNKIKN